jgi:hypothetical protein
MRSSALMAPLSSAAAIRKALNDEPGSEASRKALERVLP